MRRRRFQVDFLGDANIRVDGKEAEHALRVLRLEEGDGVILFDGGGREVEGQIKSVAEDAFEVSPTGPIRELRNHGRPLVLAVATPKGDRADWMIEKCAELGVRAVRWIETERGQVAPGIGKLSRWRRKAGEAAKQAGHARVMEIHGPVSIGEAMVEGGDAVTILFGDPSTEARSLIEVADELRTSAIAPKETIVFIGPEGGFTEAESAAILAKGGRGVRLAGAILRIETAAVAAASIWACAASSSR